MKKKFPFLSAIRSLFSDITNFFKEIDAVLTIKIKIIVLSGFIITALILFVLTTYVISNNEKKAFDSINLLNSITQNIFNLVSIEDGYISTDDETYLSKYVHLKDELDLGFKRLISYSDSVNQKEVKKLLGLNKTHGEIFSNVIIHKNNIRKYRYTLELEVRSIRNIISSFLNKNLINESKFNMERSSKTPFREIFRAENYKLLLFFLERLSFHQNINIYTDFENLDDLRKENNSKIEVVEGNIRKIMSGNFGISGFGKVFKDAADFKEKVLEAEENLINEYKTANKTLHKLSVSSESVKSLCSKIYTNENLHIKKQLEFRNFIIIGIMAFALFTILILSLLLFNSIMGSIFKTIEIVKAVSTGDLDIELKLNQKGEMTELSESVNRMIENLRLKAEFAERVSNGILSGNLETGGEKDLLGSALLDMAENLSLIISNIRNTSENVLGNSEKITNISRFLKEGSETQLSSLRKIAEHVEEIRDMAENNYGDAKDVNELALLTRDHSQRGYGDVKEMQRSIMEINNASRDIVKINKVIDDIAFQTQLLSLNASIEAARAGKHGRGFSVVASEIRNLAEKSSFAANETNNIIKETLNIISRGRKTAQDAMVTFEEIVKGIKRVTELIDSIVKSSFEQQKGIGDINDGIRLIEQVSVKNAGNSVDADRVTDELLKQVDELKVMLSKFRLQ